MYTYTIATCNNQTKDITYTTYTTSEKLTYSDDIEHVEHDIISKETVHVSDDEMDGLVLIHDDIVIDNLQYLIHPVGSLLID